MVEKVLIIGASGRIGTQVLKEFERNSDGVALRLATRQPDEAQQWRAEGREAVVMDLDRPETFTQALEGVDRVFLLTGYTAAMLVQSKKLIDAARQAGVSHLVHLGVYSSRQDLMPHFSWHDLIETYIEASGMAWTHVHPNVIADSVLVANPPITQTGAFTMAVGDTPQGWVFAEDIGAVVATVLREGPEKHAGANYWLSTELLSCHEVSRILTEVTGREINYHAITPADLAAYVATIESVPDRLYMESAVITMELATAGKMQFQTVVRDDVLTVIGRPGITVAQWAAKHLKK